MPVRRHYGGVSVTALHDGAGPFFDPRQRAFPDASAQQWRAADARDPDAVRGGEWWLRFRCFAVRLPDGRTVLVDTGVDAPARSWAPVPGRLPDELAAAGIAPADVDTVVLTHLHTDHIGWAMGAGGTPYFPNARYLLQAAELGSVRAGQPELVSWLLDPLRATTAPGRPVRTVARALATAATGRGAPPADPAARPAVRQRRPAASASAARTPAASRSVP